MTLKNKYMSISLDQAEKLSHAAKAKASEIGVAVNIAIVDEGANLVCFHRMDNAWLGSLDISIKKAKTARYFDMNTIPIKNASGKIIGAIGVSGASVEQDHEVATAGVNDL